MSITFEAVDAFYGRSQVLHDVSLSVVEGEITAILGRNGVGKTSLLRTLMGLLDRSTGSIRMGAREIGHEPTYRRARAGIAYVPQGRQIVPDFSVRENILMGGFASRTGKRSVPDLVDTLFPYLTANLERAGGLLSGGQQQQLAIARALAAEPSVLLLDEPSEGIQPSIVDEIQRIIIRLNSELRMTVLLVEQNVAFVRRAAHRFVMMQKGRIAAGGAIDALTEQLIHRHMAV